MCIKADGVWVIVNVVCSVIANIHKVIIFVSMAIYKKSLVSFHKLRSFVVFLCNISLALFNSELWYLAVVRCVSSDNK